MRAEFISSQELWREYDQVLIADGETSNAEIAASVSVTADGAFVARVDILASAGESCFRSLRSIDSIVYIGIGRFVFVVDVRHGHVHRHPLSGYFGHLYDSCDLEHLDGGISVLATSASEVLAFDRKGALAWKQSDLGIDGVVLHRAGMGRIDGEGEWDPPGGWRPFSLRSDTGVMIVNDAGAGHRVG